MYVATPQPALWLALLARPEAQRQAPIASAIRFRLCLPKLFTSKSKNILEKKRTNPGSSGMLTGNDF